MGRSAELAVSVPLRGLPPRGRSGTVCSAHSCKLFPTSRHLLPQPCSRTSLRNWGPGVMGETLARNDTYLAHTRWARACAARSRSVRVYSPHAPCLVCFATARRKPPPPGTCCACSARAVLAGCRLRSAAMALSQFVPFAIIAPAFAGACVTIDLHRLGDRRLARFVQRPASGYLLLWCVQAVCIIRPGSKPPTYCAPTDYTVQALCFRTLFYAPPRCLQIQIFGSGIGLSLQRKPLSTRLRHAGACG